MKYKILVSVAAILLIIGIAGSVFVLNSRGGSVVEITQNDKVIRTIDLQTAGDECFDIEYGGSKNTIEINVFLCYYEPYKILKGISPRASLGRNDIFR